MIFRKKRSARPPTDGEWDGPAPETRCICNHQILQPENRLIYPRHGTIPSLMGRCLIAGCPCVFDPANVIQEDPI